MARAPFRVETGKSYQVAFTLTGTALSLVVDGTPLLTATDASYAHGMAGIRLASAGRMSVGRIEIVETV